MLRELNVWRVKISIYIFYILCPCVVCRVSWVPAHEKVHEIEVWVVSDEFFSSDFLICSLDFHFLSARVVGVSREMGVCV